MSEAFPEDARGPLFPEPDPRAPLEPHLRGTAPADDDLLRPNISPTGEPISFDERAPVEAPRSEARPPEEPNAVPRLTAVPSRRRGLHVAAERLGSAVGVAEREVRRRLERPVIPFPEGHRPEAQGVEQEAARQLDNLSEQASAGMRVLRSRVASSRQRAREIAEAFPLQTILLFAGAGFLIGVALRFSRRSSRG